MHVFGLDIGGSGIKGAPVDVERGELLGERFRIPTPQPATPESMIATAAEVVRSFGWDGPIGCGFPAVVKQGVVHTAANIAPEWIGYDLCGALQQTLSMPVHALNDADAAGLAEMHFGAGRGQRGVVLMITIGTGLGTALFVDGVLVPNTELGHIEIRGKDAELRASDRVREQKELSWKQFARRFDEYLDTIQRLLWPDLIILGGGVSKIADKFVPRLTSRAPIAVAQFYNNAGIVGAALAGRPEHTPVTTQDRQVEVTDGPGGEQRAIDDQPDADDSPAEKPRRKKQRAASAGK